MPDVGELPDVGEKSSELFQMLRTEFRTPAVFTAPSTVQQRGAPASKVPVSPAAFTAVPGPSPMPTAQDSWGLHGKLFLACG